MIDKEQHMRLKMDREFGQAITDLIDLFKANFKPLISIYLRYGLSILVVGFLVGMIGASTINLDLGLDADGPLGSIVAGGIGNSIFTLFYMLAILSMTAAIYGYVSGYEEGGMESALQHVRDSFWPNIGRVLSVYLVIILAIAILGSIGFLFFNLMGMFVALLALPLMIIIFYFGVRFSLAPYIATKPGFSVLESFSESGKLVEGRFWWTFGLVFVIGLIGSILQAVLSLPLTIISILPVIEGGNPSDMNFGTTYLVGNFLVYAGYMIFFMCQTLLIPLMYYSLFDRKYGVQLEERIERVERKRDSLFENEGEV